MLLGRQWGVRREEEGQTDLVLSGGDGSRGDMAVFNIVRPIPWR